jgi:DNA helicase HerA-like ATPase
VQRLAIEPRALSADGQTFSFLAPVAAEIPIGGYVRLRTQGGVDYLGQVTEKTVTERQGPELSVAGDAGLGGTNPETQVAHTTFRVRLQEVAGQGLLLGRLTPEGVRPTTPVDVFEEAEIAPADATDLERYLRGRHQARAVLDVGTLRAGDGTARATLLAAGFDRHTFLCGQSGSGKTYSLGVILERLLLETDLRMVIVDPNSDFVHLGSTRPFAEAASGFGAGLDESGYDTLCQRFRSATAELRVFRPAQRGTRPPDALRLRFSELTPAVQAMVLQLDPLTHREEFSTYSRIIEHLGDRPYSLADLRAAAAADLTTEGRQVALRIANLGVADWDVWAEADESVLGGGKNEDARALVLDVGAFAYPAEKSLVALGLLNYLWARREERRPILVVIDEAHNICPQEPADRLQAAATERAIQIAGEGRKFGMYLLLSTQRPQKLHANVLSQCDNLVLMRMNSAADLNHLAHTFSFVAPSLLAASSTFGQGEALLAGKIVPSPLLARFGGRISREGGSDVPTTWAAPR